MLELDSPAVITTLFDRCRERASRAVEEVRRSMGTKGNGVDTNVLEALALSRETYVDLCERIEDLRREVQHLRELTGHEVRGLSPDEINPVTDIYNPMYRRQP